MNTKHCECCGNPIVRKDKSAIYCKKCGRDITDIRGAIHTTISNIINSRFEDYKVNLKIEIKKAKGGK